VYLVITGNLDYSTHPEKTKYVRLAETHDADLRQKETVVGRYTTWSKAHDHVQRLVDEDSEYQLL
jgi:hypothetical protein